MKKSLLALAVLGAFAGVASAQSSVNLFGTVDLNARYVKNDGTSRRYSMSQDGLASSQLGFKGTEDLGGGLKAGFEFLAGLNPDTGSTSANSQFFNRRSVLKLSGGFGEIRLGRDYAPSFWNLTVFDAFGTLGIASSLNVAQLYSGTRRDNSIGYFLPSGIGGVYGQAMVAAGESGTTLDRGGRYVGGRVGFAAGPFDIAAAYAQQRFASGAADQKTANVGGSYDLGVAKLMAYYNQDKQGNLKDQVYSVGATVPLGNGYLRGSYDSSKLTGAAGGDSKVNQIALGYVYNLSKRTAVYTTVSRLDNKDNTTKSIAGGNAGITAGGKSTAAEFGIRHFF